MGSRIRRAGEWLRAQMKFALWCLALGVLLYSLKSCWVLVTAPFRDRAEIAVFEKMLTEAEATAEAVRLELFTLILQEPTPGIYFDPNERILREGLYEQRYGEWQTEKRRLESRLREAEARADRARIKLRELEH